MKKNLSTPLIYLVLLVVIIALVSGFDPRGNTAEEVSYNDFIQLVRDEKVSYVDITDLQLVGLYVDSELSEETFPAKYDFYTYIPSLEAYREDMTILTEELKGIPRDQVTNADFPVESMANPTPKPSIWEGLLPYVLMIGALAVLYYFMFRSQGGGNSVMNFGKSQARNEAILNQLAAAGVDVRPFFPAQHGTPTRLHVALALVAGGFAPTIGEAFRNYLFRGTPGYVETKRILPEDAIALIHQAGGLAVLAHPCKVKADVAALVARLHPAGLDGLEAFYPTATPGQRDTYISMARQYGMLLTCGSDFHGDNRPDNRLGCTWQQSPLLEPVYTWLVQRS